MHTVTIKKDRIASLERRHPWIFSRGIISDTTKISEGSVVQVVDKLGKVYGVGHFQSGSIMVRVLSFTESLIDKSFYAKKIASAYQSRIQYDIISPNTNAYRLIHGEGDGLPGLIIDIYHTVAVVQAHSIGMYLSLDLIQSALLEVLANQLTDIYVKSGATLPTDFGHEVKDHFMYGNGLTGINVLEHGVPFHIDFVTGQKTGFFLDQRENRLHLMKHSKGKKVLNLFCYTGGFSMYALVGGASEVTSVDVSASAMELVERNFQLGGYTTKHNSITDNVMSYLQDCEDQSYDIVVVDPPAFAKSLKKRHNAVQAYKRLNAKAMSKVRPGGYLYTFSCSQVVDSQLFYDTIVAASIEHGNNVRVLDRLNQGADHPTNIYHPEGHYLKGLILQIG